MYWFLIPVLSLKIIVDRFLFYIAKILNDFKNADA